MHLFRRNLRLYFIVILLSTATSIIAGCGGGSADSPTPPAPILPPAPIAPVVFSANLQWTPPSIRLDGEPLILGDIKAYDIYMGSTPEDLSLFKNIDNPQTLSLEITGLSSGTYYFAVTAYDDQNIQSPLSTIIRKDF